MELIDRERLISEKSWDAPIKDYVTGDIQCVQVVDVGDIEEFPAVDAVEVVRCKDCYYFDKLEVNKKGFMTCRASGMDCDEECYCSFAERKEVQE